MAIDQPSVLACGYRSLLQIRMLSQITLRKLANGGSPPMIGSSTRWIATLNNFRLGLVGQSLYCTRISGHKVGVKRPA